MWFVYLTPSVPSCQPKQIILGRARTENSDTELLYLEEHEIKFHRSNKL